MSATSHCCQSSSVNIVTWKCKKSIVFPSFLLHFDPDTHTHVSHSLTMLALLALNRFSPIGYYLIRLIFPDQIVYMACEDNFCWHFIMRKIAFSSSLTHSIHSICLLVWRTEFVVAIKQNKYWNFRATCTHISHFSISTSPFVLLFHGSPTHKNRLSCHIRQFHKKKCVWVSLRPGDDVIMQHMILQFYCVEL